MASAHSAGDSLTLRGEHEAAIFFVADETLFAELLHHLRHRGLADTQGARDVHYVRASVVLAQFVDALKVILGALRSFWHQGGA